MPGRTCQDVALDEALELFPLAGRRQVQVWPLQTGSAQGLSPYQAVLVSPPTAETAPGVPCLTLEGWMSQSSRSHGTVRKVTPLWNQRPQRRRCADPTEDLVRGSNKGALTPGASGWLRGLSV